MGGLVVVEGRKRRRSSLLRRLLRRLNLGGGGGSSLAKSSKRVRRARPSTDLSFNMESSWAWSIRVYGEDRLLGTMHAASPYALVGYLEEYFVDYGRPGPDYSLHLCCNLSGKKLKLGPSVVAKLGADGDDESRRGLLQSFDRHFDRHMKQFGDSTSVSVMTDELGNILNSKQLLARVFGNSESDPTDPEP